MKKLIIRGRITDYMADYVVYNMDYYEDEDFSITVDSVGGGVFAGTAIRSAIESHKGKVSIYITGLCASIASTFVLVADEVVMCLGTMMMIHNPATNTNGDERQHEKSKEILAKAKKNLISLYKPRLKNLTDEEISNLLDNETYFTPDEALKIGLIDRIGNKNDKTEKKDMTNEMLGYSLVAEVDLSNFKNMPEDFKNIYLKGLNNENENENTLEDSMPMSAEQQKEMDDLKAQALEDSKKIGGLEAKVSTLSPQAELATGLQAANDALTTTNEELTASKEAAESKLTALESEKLTAESEKAFKNDYPFLVDEDGSQLSALMQAKKLGNEAIVATIENSYKQLNAARDPKVNSMLNELGADGDPEPSNVSEKDYEAKIASTMRAEKVDRMGAIEILDKASAEV